LLSFLQTDKICLLKGSKFRFPDILRGYCRRSILPRFPGKEAIFLLLLVGSMFGVYRHTLKYDLIWDTKNFAASSLLLQKNRPLADAFRYGLIQGQFGENKNSFYYRPIMNLSMMVENKLWGFHGTGIRLVNIAIFSLALIFLFIFFKLQAVFEDFPYLCTALFAFLPLNADNVIWGVARCDLFLLLWGLLTLIFFHFHLLKNSRSSYFLALVFFALGIFSKETFVFFIPVLAVYEWAYKKRLCWLRHSAFIMIAAAFFIVKHWALQLASLGSQPMPAISENIHVLFSTLGYYVRILLFPIQFPRFAFTSEVLRPAYFLLGIGSFLAIASYLLITRFKKNIIPLSLTSFFLIPFVWLAFSKLWPFKISARYMMIPAIGVIWLLVMSLGKLKRYLRCLACLALIALFLPFLLQSSFTYRNETTYWAEGYNAHPHNGVAILLLARAHYDAGNKIAAYHYLKESWKYPVDALTARHISVLSASLEYLRCDYPAALSWLERFQAGSTYDAYRLRASIQLARGDMKAAERILLQLIRQYPERPLAYQLLLKAYIGQTEWDKASALEAKMNSLFSPGRTRETENIRSEFSIKSDAQLTEFYSRYENYAAATCLLEQKTVKESADFFALLELYYRQGKPEKAEDLVDSLLQDHRENISLLNRLGGFYLNELYRPERALKYFQLSIRIRPRQFRVHEMIGQLSIYQPE
jgi:Tfp pilus assembly protein PilF